MPASTPVAFGAILAGGLMLDHGVKMTKTAFATAQAATPAGGTVGGSGTITGPASAGTPTGSYKGLSSPFAKKYTANLSNTDMGVDFGMQQGIRPGDPLLALGPSTLRLISPFYAGQPAMWMEFDAATKAATGHWGYYYSEQMAPRIALNQTVKAGDKIAEFVSSGTGIEIGWASSAGVTETQGKYPGEVAGRHSGNGTTPGRDFLAFLQHVGAI